MTKLVADLRLIHNSGIGTYIKNIFPDILDRFSDVSVLGDPNELSNFAWYEKVKVITFNSKTYSIQEQLLFPFKVPKCDVFWSPHFNTPIFPIAAKRRVATIHDINHIANPQFFSAFKKLWAKMLYKNTVKKSDQIITVSEFSKAEIIKNFKVEKYKVKVVKSGVNKLFIECTCYEEGISLPEKYILFVGNVKPHKNLITLLKAYVNLENSEKSEYKLVILGKKDGFITGDEEVFDFIKRNNLKDSIYFTGQIEDKLVPIVYKKASLFVFPSLYEGFGLPILEALASGVPTLSSNKASLPEVGGDAVIYFDPKDYLELKEAIHKLLYDENLRSHLISKGYKRVKEFSWEKAAAKHYNILKLKD